MSDLVGNPKDRFSGVAAQMIVYIYAGMRIFSILANFSYFYQYSRFQIVADLV